MLKKSKPELAYRYLPRSLLIGSKHEEEKGLKQDEK
jgi:hypothetical protein